MDSRLVVDGLEQGCQTNLPQWTTFHQSIQYAGQIIMSRLRPLIREVI